MNPNTVMGGQPLNAWLNMLVSPEEAALAPGWVWAVLPNASFRLILSSTSLGAIEMAHGEVKAIEGKSRITLKQLMCSGNVTSKFAEFTANVMMKRSGGNAYPSFLTTGNRGNQRFYNVSAGYKHRTAQNANMIGFRIWFQDVFTTTNPAIVDARGELATMDPNDPRRIAYAQVLQDYERELPKILRHL